jgi:hypothetical protein
MQTPGETLLREVRQRAFQFLGRVAGWNGDLLRSEQRRVVDFS